MTSSSQTALKIIVERAVRPVQATQTRKKTMREELLMHVTDVFHEEFAVVRDESVAVAKTAQRFGDPQDVARQLQASVPPWQPARVRLNALLTPDPNDRPVVAALRAARNMTIVMVGSMAFAMMLGISALDAREKFVLLSFLAPYAIASAILAFSYVLLAMMLRRDWFATAGKHSRLRLVFYLAASPVPVLLVPFVFALFVGHTLEVPPHLESVVPFLPLVPAALYFATRQYHEECECAREWKSLELD